jgi:hypothetical protein
MMKMAAINIKDSTRRKTIANEKMSRAAQAVGHDFHDSNREKWYFVHHEREPMLVERKQFAIRAGEGIGASRSIIDERQFTEETVGSHGLDYSAPDNDVHFTLLNDEHFVAGLSGLEDGCTGGKIAQLRRIG